MSRSQAITCALAILAVAHCRDFKESPFDLQSPIGLVSVAALSTASTSTTTTTPTTQTSTFVVVAQGVSGCHIWRSSDSLQSWTAVGPSFTLGNPPCVTLRDVAYSGTSFVAAGADSSPMPACYLRRGGASDLVWNQPACGPPNTDDSINALAASGNTIVAVGLVNGTPATKISTNSGSDWTNVAGSGGNSPLTAATVSNGTVFAGNQNAGAISTMFRFTNTSGWVSAGSGCQTSNPAAGFLDMKAGDGNAILATTQDANSPLISFDGTSCTGVTGVFSGQVASLRSVAYRSLDSRWVAVGSSCLVDYTSAAEGRTGWLTAPAVASAGCTVNFSKVIYSTNLGLFIAVGQSSGSVPFAASSSTGEPGSWSLHQIQTGTVTSVTGIAEGVQ